MDGRLKVLAGRPDREVPRAPSGAGDDAGHLADRHHGSQRRSGRITDGAANPLGQHDAAAHGDALLHRNVLESMGEGVLTVTADGRVGILNPAASRLLGLAGVEAQGQPFAEIFLHRPGLEAFSDTVLAAVYDEAVGARSTLSLRLADGTQRSAAVTTSYLVRRTGGETQRIGIVAVLDDVTEVEALRQAERELAAATQAQNVELREAYREIEGKNTALDAALKKVQAARVLAMLLVVVLFGGAAWYVWDEAGTVFPRASEAASAVAPDVLSVTVAPRRLVSTLSYVGRLAPRAEVRVTSRAAGQVARVLVEYGDRVQAGQPLLELDNTETNRRHLEARAGYLEARDKLRELEDWENSAEMTRLRQAVALAGMELEARERKLAETALLLEQGVIPASEHETARRQYEAQRLRHEAALQDVRVAYAKADADTVQIARLRLENAATRMRGLQQTLADAVIRAPISGVVLQPDGGPPGAEGGDGRRLAAGSFVSEGAYLLSIGDLGGLSVAGGIDEVDVVKVKPGQPVRISGDAFPDLVFAGRIERISPQSRTDGNARVPTFDVNAVIDRLAEAHLARLRLGMSANVTVVVRDEPAALLVPIDAVLGSSGNHRVRLQGKDGAAPREVPVQVGETTLYEVEILDGLKAGDEVIVAGT